MLRQCTILKGIKMRQAFLLAVLFMLLGLFGCGGQSGGFPTGLGDGLIEDAKKSVVLHMRWQTNPQTGVPSNRNGATDNSDALANGQDGADVLGANLSRVIAPVGATDAWVTLQGAGLGGSNVSFFVSSHKSFRDGGTSEYTGVVADGAMSQYVKDSGVPVTSAGATNKSDLRNSIYQFTVPVFRAGDVTVIVQFFSRDEGSSAARFGDLARIPRDKVKGVATFVSKFPTTNRFSILKGVAEDQDLEARGKVIRANVTVTGLPPTDALNLGKSVSVQAVETGGGTAPTFIAYQNRTAPSQTPTENKLEFLIVDRQQPFKFTARLHSGTDATGLVLKSDVVSQAVPLNADEVNLQIEPKDNAILVAEFAEKTVSGTTGALRLEDGSAPITFHLQERGNAALKLQLDDPDKYVEVPTVNAGSPIDFAGPQGPPSVKFVQLRKYGNPGVKFQFKSAIQGLSPTATNLIALKVRSVFTTLGYAGTAGGTGASPTFTVARNSEFEIALVLKPGPGEAVEPKIVLARTPTNANGGFVQNKIGTAFQVKNTFVIKGLSVGSGTVTYGYQGPEGPIGDFTVNIEVPSDVTRLFASGFSATDNTTSPPTDTFEVLYGAFGNEALLSKVLAFELGGSQGASANAVPLSASQYRDLTLVGFRTGPSGPFTPVVPANFMVNGQAPGTALTGTPRFPLSIVSTSPNPTTTFARFKYSGPELNVAQQEVVVKFTVSSKGSLIAEGLETTDPLSGPSLMGRFALKVYESKDGDSDKRAKKLPIKIAGAGVLSLPLSKFTIVQTANADDALARGIIKVINDGGGDFTAANLPRLRGLKEGTGVLYVGYNGDDIPASARGAEALKVKITVLAGNSTVVIK